MKRPFLWLFIGANIIFVILIIYKNSRMIELSYTKQRLEKEKSELIKDVESVEQSICLLQSHKSVKQFAQDELKMKQLTLKDIRHLPDDQRL